MAADPELPDELVERLHDLVDDGDALVETLQARRPPTVRVNTLKADPKPARRLLEEAGLDLEPVPWAPHTFRVRGGDPGTTVPHVLGWIYVQSATSMLPPLAVRDELADGPRVLDGCAAPGSKATQAAALMGNRGTLVANDVDEGRVAALKNNLGRCGVTNAVITEQDLRHVHWEGPYDLTFVDVPCSGEGILRKTWSPLDHWSPHHISSIAGVQKELLEKALDLTRAGGTVVYSTCTFAPEECEAVVDDVLDGRDAEIRPVDLGGLATRPGRTAWQGEVYADALAETVRVYPQDNDTDGFYLAVIDA